jgi:hypothetical protein
MRVDFENCYDYLAVKDEALLQLMATNMFS